MKKIQYINILKESFSITWENKFLWFFGFLIFIGSFGGNLKINDGDSVDQQRIVEFVQNNLRLVVFLAVAFIIVVLILFLLRTLAFAGIIKSANDINLYKQLSVVAILKESKKYFWKLFLLSIVIFVVLMSIMLVLGVPVAYLFALKASVLASVTLFLAIAIILPLLILASYLHHYASLRIILADENLKISLESAYALFIKNIKESLVMSLVMFITRLLLLIVIVSGCLFVAIIFSPVGLIAYLIFAKIGIIVIAIIAALICGAFLMTVFSWYEAFLQTAWLVFFKQIAFEKDKELKTVEELAEMEVKIPNPEVV
ncbi:MAG: hypothetical protein US57_C0014G0002 [Candidatus Moranbacteria bacterium GW2011_GWC2_37_73]|nr:MAG: hypothetical protein UR95_C0002G0022 [Parcubacteria group bacterium GW2011_GWC1_36_108]KKQ00319.1 MAG: hypothetical protein US09_C0014G0013 [Candidatus Moranbacteria bacterium GW2011_GWD1_36_198]KKQ01376.1 MAG: hypothetical protein US10_C0014G0002 [Candidatus Moranbacteria bacterium GW2011_GWD2_36_198]KKQ39379.1 MAG: hypothetical protein US57_C0014G0002 [Candidatus Moranbacteria bacterium GW2011_GWC2_37_73]HAR99497.1 hypothetical protein [Candidatus Moranbacteria bacterium]